VSAVELNHLWGLGRRLSGLALDILDKIDQQVFWLEFCL
jgi:hypothetical protein